MIAIFNTEVEANTFSDKIHNFLIKNRKDYSAERWCTPDKSDTEEKWSVKIPYDYDRLKLVLDITTVEKIEKFPIEWTSVRSIEPIDITKVINITR